MLRVVNNFLFYFNAYFNAASRDRIFPAFRLSPQLCLTLNYVVRSPSVSYLNLAKAVFLFIPIADWLLLVFLLVDSGSLVLGEMLNYC